MASDALDFGADPGRPPRGRGLSLSLLLTLGIY